MGVGLVRGSFVLRGSRLEVKVAVSYGDRLTTNLDPLSPALGILMTSLLLFVYKSDWMLYTFLLSLVDKMDVLSFWRTQDPIPESGK